MFSSYFQIISVLPKTIPRSIKQNNYIHLLMTAELDWSDYVLIASALIKEVLGSKVEKELISIQELYLRNEKLNAIKLIFKICQEHPRIFNDKKLFACLEAKVANLKDNPLALDSRRYFETRFSLEMWKAFSENEFKTLTKLSALIRDIDPTIKIPDVVTTEAEAERVIDLMEKCADIEAVHIREKELRKISALFSTKNRGLRRIDIATNSIWSVNPGIMKSLAYNPYDELITAEKNRHPDMSLLNQQIENGFSQSRADVPFVNSLSGHTIILLTVIERYKQKYKNLSELQSDIDNLVKVFIAFTAKRGFHSLSEMFSLIHEANSRVMRANEKEQKAVEMKSIEILNMDFPAAVLQHAFIKAADYSYISHFKKSCNKQIVPRRIPSSNLNWDFDKSIIECNSILDVLNYSSQEKPLFIFDLDNTVLRPSQVHGLGSDQWFEKFVEYISKTFPDNVEAFNLALILRNAIHKNISLKLVEKEVIEIIQTLQACNIPVIALTSRGPSIVDTTEVQMQEFKIAFSELANTKNKTIELTKAKHHDPVYRNGIIYCDGIDKGIALNDYLRRIKFLPRSIVMIDDAKKNLIRVKEALTNLPIRFHGLRYNYLDKQIANFDMTKANQKLLEIRNKFSVIENAALDKLEVFTHVMQEERELVRKVR